MPEENIDQKRPAHAESELKKMQQRLVDETVDESFPASDPPAWTTTGSKSVAARYADAEESSGNESREEQDQPGQAARMAERAYEAGRHYVREAQERFPQAQRYMAQGRRTVSQPVASYPLTAVILAGAVGFGLAWWIYGGAQSGSRQVPAYGKRQRYGWRPGPMTTGEQQRAEAHLAATSRAAGAAGAAPNSF